MATTYTLSGTVTSAAKFLHQAVTALGLTYTGNPGDGFSRAFSSTDVTKIFYNTYSVTTSATSIDVTSLTDPFGVAVNFATIKHLLIINNDTTKHLSVGGGTNGLFAALPTLVGQTGSDPGSAINLTTNLTVDGTHKIIALTASSGTISVDVFIVGA